MRFIRNDLCVVHARGPQHMFKFPAAIIMLKFIENLMDRYYISSA